jgi:septal ring factor EnvC (AmiA/AmiB activator)
MAPMQQVVDELKDDIKGSQDEGKKLMQQREHADKAIRATEAEIQELMKAHPEAVKQLAAMGS